MELSESQEAQIKAQIGDCWKSAQAHAFSMLADFIEIGRCLQQLKNALPHGQFTPYVGKNFPYLGKTQRWRAMKAFEAHERREREGRPLVGTESVEKLIDIAQGRDTEQKFRAGTSAPPPPPPADDPPPPPPADPPLDDHEDEDGEDHSEPEEVESLRQLMYVGLYAAHNEIQRLRRNSDQCDASAEEYFSNKLFIALVEAKETENEDIPGDVKDCWPLFKAIANFVDAVESHRCG